MSLGENWNILKGSVHKAMLTLEKREATEGEAFFTNTQTTDIAIRNSEVHTQNMICDAGVGFRVIVRRNKIGFACTNSLSQKAISEALEKASSIARASSEVPNFALPRVTELPQVTGLFNREVEEMDVDEGVDIAKRMLNAAQSVDDRVVAKSGRVLFESGRRGVINTFGVDLEERETRSVLYLDGSGEQDGEGTGSCYDATFNRGADVNPEKIGENVGKMVMEMFGPKHVESFEGTVIFGPEAVSNQLFTVLVDALKGENVVADRSAWTNKRGEQVAFEKLTIRDNALLKGGFASRSFDDEGSASHNTCVIRKGRLERFLHDATSADASGEKNTGNASRFPSGFDMIRAIVGNGYRSKPEIYPSNLMIQPGNKAKRDLISEIDKGILAESMAGFAQPGSGMISTKLARAFYIESGEILHPIKGGMVSGVAFDWFKQISGIGNDARQFMNSVIPSLRVENVKFIGA